MMRPKPPEAHTRKLIELVARQLPTLPLPEGMHPAEHYAAIQVRGYLHHVWQPGERLPHGSATLYLRLRGITAPGARPALSAALHGRRVCPPGAAYAPVGWREFIEEAAAKAAKDAQ